MKASTLLQMSADEAALPDEFALHMKIGVLDDNRVGITFPRPISWIAMDPADARQIAASLLAHADSVERPEKLS